MKIGVTYTPHPRPTPDMSALGFGRYFADHMFLMEYSAENGWHDPRVEPYHDLGLEPGNLTLHYGQSIFEGLKAFHRIDGSLALFRANDHVERFRKSAARLVMPDFDPALMLEGLLRLVDVDRNWVPRDRGTALYLRPTMIAADNALGVRPSKNYYMFVIASPVGNYYAKGMAPTRILVEESFSRAAMGGLGEAKTGANYAASLFAAERAKAQGFDQVLWLDAKSHKYVEEVGTMNIFFVLDETLVTPPLGGTILDGITRRTVLALAREWGLPIEERRISMEEVAAAHADGRLKEVFGSGTAATISQVGELFYQGRPLVIEEPKDSIRARLYKTITGIHYGEIEDTHGWLMNVPHMGTSNGTHGRMTNGDGHHLRVDESFAQQSGLRRNI